MRCAPPVALRRPTLGLGTLLALLGACTENAVAPLGPPAPSNKVVICPIDEQASCDPPPPPPPPAYGAKYGLVGGGLADGAAGYTDADVRRIMGLVKQSGARYMRETFYWRLAQPNGAYFDPAWLQAADRLVAAAADSGVVLQITLATTPGWVRGNDCDPTHAQDPNYRVPGDNSCNSYNSSWYPPYPNMWIWYRNYIGDLVARYGDRVKYWGIWNEPNTSDFLKLPPNGDYADWTQVYDWMWGYAADVIPNTPDVSMIGPEIGIGADPNATALEAFMWRSGYRLRPQDIVGIHFYGLEYPTGPSSMETLVRSHDAVLSRWGVGNKIWMTEEGLGQPETDDAVQANSVAQALTAFNQTSVARWTAIFRFHLWSPAQTDFYDEWLVKNALTTPIVRPGYYCFQAFARGFERPYGCQP